MPPPKLFEINVEAPGISFFEKKIYVLLERFLIDCIYHHIMIGICHVLPMGSYIEGFVPSEGGMGGGAPEVSRIMRALLPSSMD